jgi:putative Mg2+ transporter-C (MgtC) family protein
VSISDGEVVLRLGLSLVLCGAIGLERESRSQPAGVRTHILVGLGATLFTLVSAYAFTGSEATRVDPTRIAAQIVTGIGFLGAGTIIRQGLTVRGLTTAAALWIVAAIGMAVGAGYYVGAAATTVVILVTLIGIRRWRGRLMARLRTGFVLLDLEMERDADLAGVLATLGRRQVQVEGLQTDRGAEVFEVRIELEVPPGADLEGALEEIGALEGLRGMSVRGAGVSSGRGH